MLPRGRRRVGARGSLIDPTGSLALVRHGCLNCSGDCDDFGGIAVLAVLAGMGGGCLVRLEFAEVGLCLATSPPYT